MARSPDTEALLPQSARTPLPKGQLLAVYTIKLMVPVTAFQVLPYLNEMVAQAVNRPPKEVGYYSGLIGTVYTTAHLLTVYPWARLSDWVGRVPVIVAGMAGLAGSLFLFGLSGTLATIIFTRFLAGLFAGIVGALHSVVGELVDESNYSTAFPLYDIMAALGFIVGPLLGGNLSNPARYPALDYPFLRSHPYFLPCAVASVLSSGAAFLAAFYLRETNARKAKSPSETQASGYGSTITPPEPATSAPLTVKELLATPSLRAVCACSAAVGLIGAAFNTVVVLIAYTPLDSGGLSLDPSQIAWALSLMGTISIFLKLTLPIVLRRTTSVAVFKIALLAWVPTFAGLALLPALARRTGSPSVPLWIGLGIVLFLSRVGCLTFSLLLILTREHTPDPSALGAANGIIEVVQMIGIALTPATISALFAASVTHNLLGGYLWAIVAIAVSAACTGLADRIDDKSVHSDADRHE